MQGPSRRVKSSRAPPSRLRRAAWSSLLSLSPAGLVRRVPDVGRARVFARRRRGGGSKHGRHATCVARRWPARRDIDARHSRCSRDRHVAFEVFGRDKGQQGTGCHDLLVCFCVENGKSVTTAFEMPAARRTRSAVRPTRSRRSRHAVLKLSAGSQAIGGAARQGFGGPTDAPICAAVLRRLPKDSAG